MKLAQIISKIQLFNQDGKKDELEITEFFDEIGEQLSNVPLLNDEQKSTLLKNLFFYLEKQLPDTDEDFSFIHLIESIDAVDYTIYDKMLLLHCEAFPSITSLLLLNRYINGLKEKAPFLKLLRDISVNSRYALIIRETAQEYLDYQKDK